MFASPILLTRRSPWLLAAATIVALTAAPQIAASAPVNGGTLTWAVDRESTNIVPINTTTFLSGIVGPKIFDGLLSYDIDFKPEPQLAQSWTVAPDGLTYTFKLRPGVKWHDGQPLTSADVAFSIERLKEAHPRGRITFSKVASIDTPDDLTVVLHLSQPTPYLITALSSGESPIVPKHIFEKLDPAAVPPDSALIGTGPFKFVKWDRGSAITLERNPDYWDTGKPHLDRLVIRIIPDNAARSAAIEAGELDLSLIGVADVARLKATGKYQVADIPQPYLGPHDQIVLNLDNKYLSDLKVRQAIAHAIDIARLRATAWYGYGTVSPTAISPAFGKFHDDTIKPYAFDPALSNKLLDEAGYAKGSDGHRLALKIALNPANPVEVGQFIVQALKSIGIDGKLTLTDQPGYIKTVYTDRNYDIGIDALSNAFDPTVGVQRVFWSQAFKPGLPFSNPSHYASPEADQLLQQAAVEVDQDKREALFRQLQQLLYKDIPVIDYIDPPSFTAEKPRVHDIAQGAVGLGGNFADAYIEH